jgi:hypothetical protein
MQFVPQQDRGTLPPVGYSDPLKRAEIFHTLRNRGQRPRHVHVQRRKPRPSAAKRYLSRVVELRRRLSCAAERRLARTRPCLGLVPASECRSCPTDARPRPPPHAATCLGLLARRSVWPTACLSLLARCSTWLAAAPPELHQGREERERERKRREERSSRKRKKEGRGEKKKKRKGKGKERERKKKKNIYL